MYKRHVILLLTLFTTLVMSIGSVSLAQTGAKLSLSPETITIGVDQIFTSDLVVDAGGNNIGGVGAVILFDPAALMVDHIETGGSFEDYPLAAFDNTEGKVSLSGVVGSPDQLKTGVLVVGKVYWKALSTGETTIRYEYTPQSTKDSNVAVTVGSGDALSSVSDMEVTVVTDPQSTAVTQDTSGSSTTTSNQATQPASTPKPFLARTSTFVNNLLGRSESEIDPYQPISQMPPKEQIGVETPTQTRDEFTVATTSPSLVIPVAIGILILAVFMLLIIKVLRRKKSGGGIVSPANVVNPADPVIHPVLPTPPLPTTQTTPMPFVQPTPSTLPPLPPTPTPLPGGPIITKR